MDRSNDLSRHRGSGLCYAGWFHGHKSPGEDCRSLPPAFRFAPGGKCAKGVASSGRDRMLLRGLLVIGISLLVLGRSFAMSSNPKWKRRAREGRANTIARQDDVPEFLDSEILKSRQVSASLDPSSPRAVPSSSIWFVRLQRHLDAGLGSALLLLASAVSLSLANYGPSQSSWLSFWAQRLGPSIGTHALTARGWVNEGLMAMFFFSVGLEIKQELVSGCLASPRKAALPCIAALGGMVMPMAVYWVCNATMPGGSISGISVPMATDIAFAMGVFHAFRSRMPESAGSFLLALATVDDLGAIVVIAACFAGQVVPGYLAAAVGMLCAAAMIGRRQLKSTRGLVLPSVGLWYCLLRGGINADIAGVLAAFCVPLKSKSGEEVVERLIPRWSACSALIILPLFALANCAVPLGFLQNASGSTSTLPAQCVAVPMGIFLGLLLGKPLGIFGFSWLSVKAGFARMPPSMSMVHLGIISMLGAIGFTMCLFLIENSLSGKVAQVAKIAVFAGSISGAVVSAVVMALQPRLLHTRRSRSPY